MTSFTPGPWTVLPEECDKAYTRIRGTRLGGRYKIANVITPNYEGVLAREAVETRANAHLIAAAPELLEALEKIAAFAPGNGEECEIIAKIARAAIAKATT